METEPTYEQLVQRNKQLTKKLNELEKLVDTIPCRIFIKNKNHKYKFVNRYFADLVGLNKKQMIGKAIRDILPDEDNARNLEYENEVIRTGISKHNILHTIKTLTGEKIFSTNKVPYLNENSQVTGVIGASIDITEREKLRFELEKQADKLRKLIASRNKFFSIIAHDLKNPFNTILSFSKLLKNNLKNFDQKELEKIANLLYNSAEKGSELLQNLLNWSQSQTGALRCQPEKFDISLIIGLNIEFLQHFIEQKNVRVITSATEKQYVFADKEMVSIILRNLITNAVKYSFPDTEVKISTKTENGFVHVSVHDKGIGISKTDQEKLFKIESGFIRSGTKDEKGTGLGLLLCQDMVKKNNGKIRVESKSGKGSTFVFTLPCYQDIDQ